MLPNRVGLNVDVLSWVVGGACDVEPNVPNLPNLPKPKGGFADVDDAAGTPAKRLSLGGTVVVIVSLF